MKKFLILTPLFFLFVFFFITCNKQGNEKSDLPSVDFKTPTENQTNSPVQAITVTSSDSLQKATFYIANLGGHYYWGCHDSMFTWKENAGLYQLKGSSGVKITAIEVAGPEEQSKLVFEFSYLVEAKVQPKEAFRKVFEGAQMAKL